MRSVDHMTAQGLSEEAQLFLARGDGALLAAELG